MLGILCEFQQIANIILQFHTAYVNKNSVVVTQLGKVGTGHARSCLCTRLLDMPSSQHLIPLPAARHRCAGTI